MRRRNMLLPVAAMAAVVAANPAHAAEGNGWSCISPFANYVNVTNEPDPPAPQHILDSLAIDVTRTDASPLTAVPGQSLLLNNLQLKLAFTDVRIAERMYTRTGGISVSYSGIPYKQVENNSRNMSLRASPNDGGALWWGYGNGASATFVEKPETPGAPPRVRAEADTPNTVWTYATPSTSLGHRYISHTGNSQFPLDAWVAVAATNTVEGVQTLPVKGYWTINIKDATPGSPTNPANYSNDAVTATVPAVELVLPNTRWTPTGAGPVEFKIAERGKIGVVQIESEGYDRTGYNVPLNVRPFGSVFVRALSEAYGASNDCIPGQVSVADSNVGVSQTRLFFLDAPQTAQGVTMGDATLGDPATPGQFLTQGGLSAAQGIRGRFGFAETALPAIATAPLAAAPVPVPVPKPADKVIVFAGSTSVKPSKSGAVKVSFSNPNSAAVSYKLAAKTVNKYKVGKTRKVVNVTSTKTVSLKPGESKVNFSLTAAAKKLLKANKSVKVKLTLTPAAGGPAVTKTITLKRS